MWRLAELAPSRSLVDTPISEPCMAPQDVWGGFACKFAYRARALEAGVDRGAAIVRLRTMDDAQVSEAIAICRWYRETADRLIAMEVRMGTGRAGLARRSPKPRGGTCGVRVAKRPPRERRSAGAGGSRAAAAVRVAT